MPDKVVIAKFQFDSSDHLRQYVTQLYSDGSTSCDCRGWTFKRRGASKRECKHTNDVEMFAGQIIRGERRAEYWGGQTMIEVTQVFMRDRDEIRRFQEGEAIRRQAEEVAMSSLQVIAVFPHTTDDRETHFAARLYSDGEADCSCMAGAHCYMATRIRKTYGPAILSGKKTAEQFDGRTIRHTPVEEVIRDIHATQKGHRIPQSPRQTEDEAAPPKRRYNL